jgi:hypothetical protein
MQRAGVPRPAAHARSPRPTWQAPIVGPRRAGWRAGAIHRGRSEMPQGVARRAGASRSRQMPPGERHHPPSCARSTTCSGTSPSCRRRRSPRRRRARYTSRRRLAPSPAPTGSAEHLDRDIAPETAVACTVDLSHSSGANRFQQVVRSKPQHRHRGAIPVPLEPPATGGAGGPSACSSTK